MAEYTIKNLRTEVEDAAPKFDMAPAVEARFARKPLETEKLSLSYQHLAPDARMPFGHRHEQQEEVYVVVDGGGRVKLDDEIHDVARWDAVRIPAETMRCFEAGPDGLTYVVVGAPKTEPNDAELVPGWWSD